MSLSAIHKMLQSETDEFFLIAIVDGELMFYVDSKGGNIADMLLTVHDNYEEIRPDFTEFASLIMSPLEN